MVENLADRGFVSSWSRAQKSLVTVSHGGDSVADASAGRLAGEDVVGYLARVAGVEVVRLRGVPVVGRRARVRNLGMSSSVTPRLRPAGVSGVSGPAVPHLSDP
jgi:hypothetical protein